MMASSAPGYRQLPLIFLFIRFFGFDFLHASAAAKVGTSPPIWRHSPTSRLNGHLLWQVAIAMAVCNVGDR